MKVYTIIFTLSVIALIVPATSLFGQTAIDSLETIVAQNDSMIIALSSQRDVLLRQLDEKSAAIDELKAQRELSFIQRRRLQSLLQEFQEKSDTIYALDVQLQEVASTQTGAKQRLWGAYQAAINESLEILAENIETLRQNEQQRYLSRISELRAKKIALGTDFEASPVSWMALFSLTIEPDDDYQRIIDKANRLKDHEDALVKNIALIDEKLKRYGQEIEMREKLNDFMGDVSLFEQHDEAIIGAQGSNRILVENAVEWFNNEYFGGDKTLAQSSTLSEIGESLWDIDPSFLSSEEAETLIQLFSEYQSSLRLLADSLASRAQFFYKRAEQIRKSPRGGNA